MSENDAARAPLSPELVRALGSAVGLTIADERLPTVTAVLTELLDLAAELDGLDLEAVEPDEGAPRFD